MDSGFFRADERARGHVVSQWRDDLPPWLVLRPLSRHPLRLADETVRHVMTAPVPSGFSSAERGCGEDAWVRASIVVVTFNQLVCTKMCLTSLLTNTEYPNYEVIVVDNASTDETQTYLRELAARHRRVRVHFNDENRGFAPANNQALASATGDVLVLLNNDTIVTPGWLTTLVRHLDDLQIGSVGPVTNRICNEAQIVSPYETYGELIRFARDREIPSGGPLFDIRMLAMFCMAMRRNVYERVGPIDEQYEVGMLEDDDYAMRVRAAGYRVACAEDVFVHHFGKASFGELVPTGAYGELLRMNRERWEAKWGVPCEPYQQRTSESYVRLVDQVRAAVDAALPPDSIVLVVSKGDDELLQLNGRPAGHFPQGADGGYAGHHPADSAEAIAHLEALRAAGAHYLLFPRTAFWWLEHYESFRRYLEDRYSAVPVDADDCRIFALRQPRFQPIRWDPEPPGIRSGNLVSSTAGE